MKINRIHVGLASLLCTFVFGAGLGTLLTLSGLISQTTGTMVMQYVFAGGTLYIAAIAICIYGAQEKVFQSLSGTSGSVWIALIITFAFLIATSNDNKGLTASIMTGIWTMHFTVSYLKKRWISV